MLSKARTFLFGGLNKADHLEALNYINAVPQGSFLYTNAKFSYDVPRPNATTSTTKKIVGEVLEAYKKGSWDLTRGMAEQINKYYPGSVDPVMESIDDTVCIVNSGDFSKSLGSLQNAFLASMHDNLRTATLAYSMHVGEPETFKFENFGFTKYGPPEDPVDVERVTVVNEETKIDDSPENLRMMTENPGTVVVDPLIQNVSPVEVTAQVSVAQDAEVRADEDVLGSVPVTETVSETRASETLESVMPLDIVGLVNNYAQDTSAESMLNGTDGSESVAPDVAAVGPDGSQTLGLAGQEVQDTTGVSGRYHKLALQLMFGSWERPKWDTDLIQSIKSYATSDQERRVLMENIVDANGPKMMITGLYGSSEQEFIEIMELHFALERHMSQGTRVPSAFVPLSALGVSEPIDDGSAPVVKGPAEVGPKVPLDVSWDHREFTQNGPARPQIYYDVIASMSKNAVKDSYGPGLVKDPVGTNKDLKNVKIVRFGPVVDC